MFWTLALQLMPDETIIEDSTKQAISGLRPAYSVFLTNKRVIFRFDSMGSTMAQSFLYHEIVDAAPVKRLLINYLCIRTATRQYYIHTPTPDYWSKKITESKQSLGAAAPAAKTPADQLAKRRQELDSMLVTLRRYNLLTEDELEQKKKMLGALLL